MITTSSSSAAVKSTTASASTKRTSLTHGGYNDGVGVGRKHHLEYGTHAQRQKYYHDGDNGYYGYHDDEEEEAHTPDTWAESPLAS